MLSKKETVVVVVPVYNEEDCLDELIRRLVAVKKRMNIVEMDLIFVNDGSRDGSILKLHSYAKQHSFLKVISLSRNFGHQAAVTAGLDRATGEYVVIIDADLQDPPELIEAMYTKAKEGSYDIVYGKRLSRKGETLFKRLSSRYFYKFISMMCDTEIPEDTGDFRLISRRVLTAVRAMREKHRFLRGMIPWVGFKSAPLYYHRDERHAGKSKYPIKKMILFALDAIFSFSNTPLRMATYLGLIIVGLGILSGLFLMYIRFFTSYFVSGITAAILTIIIMGGVQVVMLGIIGEYIGRIFEESKGRHLYIIEEMINLQDHKAIDRETAI